MRSSLAIDVVIYILSGIGTPIFKCPCSIRVVVPLLSQLQFSNGPSSKERIIYQLRQPNLLVSNSVQWCWDASKVSQLGTLCSVLLQGVASKALCYSLTFPYDASACLCSSFKLSMLLDPTRSKLCPWSIHDLESDGEGKLVNYVPLE